MDFLKLMFKAGFGAVLLLTTVIIVPSFLLGAPAEVAVNNLFVYGLSFGCLYALWHLKRPVTLVSSLIAGIGFSMVLMAIDGTAEIPPIVDSLVTGLLAGGGGYIGARLLTSKPQDGAHK